ncbi:MAG: SH3 domain-containing protein [Anaerolineae bacterium]
MKKQWRRIGLISLTLVSLVIFTLNTVSAQDISQFSSASCAGAMPPRLIAGQQGRVTPGLPNILRSAPGQSAGSVIVGEIPGGGIFTALAGYAPQCYGGRLWWYVTYNGIYGWTPEAEVYGPYWTEPLSIVPPPITPIPSYCQPTRLTSGGQGQVMYGSANALRSLPRRGTGSQIYLYIPSGGVFALVAGTSPTCTDGVLWHYVVYNGVYGWTPESNATQYWVTPYNGGGQTACNSGLPNRLTIGGRGRVLPGQPNSLRSQASIYSTRLGYVYAGEVFTVLEGPVCNSDIPYYRVQTAAGWVGWTGEGRWGQYWVEPAY